MRGFASAFVFLASKRREVIALSLAGRKKATSAILFLQRPQPKSGLRSLPKVLVFPKSFEHYDAEIPMLTTSKGYNFPPLRVVVPFTPNALVRVANQLKPSCPSPHAMCVCGLC